ncbi:MAG: hypothetical protein Q4G04_02555 [bacterium]|nr:hypothetical protein [bacterium]
MFIIEEIKKKTINYNSNEIAIFIDMDGVVADYRFGEGDNIKNNKPGVYLNKRPINTTISIVKEIKQELNCEIYILSSCFYKEQSIEKSMWIDKYMPFINEKNRIFTIADNFESRKMLKIDAIKSKMISNKLKKAIFIDDTHDILFLAIKELGDKIIPFHVITLLD